MPRGFAVGASYRTPTGLLQVSCRKEYKDAGILQLWLFADIHFHTGFLWVLLWAKVLLMGGVVQNRLKIISTFSTISINVHEVNRVIHSIPVQFVPTLPISLAPKDIASHLIIQAPLKLH